MAYYDLEKMVGKRKNKLTEFTDVIPGEFIGTSWQEFFANALKAMKESNITPDMTMEITISVDKITVKGLREE